MTKSVKGVKFGAGLWGTIALYPSLIGAKVEYYERVCYTEEKVKERLKEKDNV